MRCRLLFRDNEEIFQVIITYFRSSSYTSWDFCQQKYFLIYVLGQQEPANLKAEKGTIFHKVMELLAKYQVERENVGPVFEDSELGTIEKVWCETNVPKLLDLSFAHYSKSSPNVFVGKDKIDIWKWLQKALTENNGAFDPRGKPVLSPEKSFNFEIDADWASYIYDWQGEKIQGKLGLKGTIDLISYAGKNSLEITDYKTGRRLDWASGKEKDLDKLYADPQLRLYHYAASRIFPEYDHIVLSIYFVNDGGCFTICFDRGMLAETEEMIKKRFFEIRNCTKPKLLSNDHSNWKCTKLCQFYKKKWPGTDQNICGFIRDEIAENGMKHVIQNYTTEGHTPHHYRSPGST